MPATPAASWQGGLPVLAGSCARLREVVLTDAEALVSEIATVEVERFIPAAPSTAVGFENFIRRSIQGRLTGECVCFAVLAPTDPTPVGLIMLRAPGPDHDSWDWGFVFGQRAWGTGLFADAATLVLGFAFDVVGIDKLEAWSILPNGRAHGALAKLGAEPELRRQVQAPDGRCGDFILWTLARPAKLKARD
jgi:RimJ/RimL family protein N-acetyltransferase